MTSPSRLSPDQLKAEINAHTREDEAAADAFVASEAMLSSEQHQQIYQRAYQLVAKLRKARVGKGGIDAFMYQYDLSSEEGIALMCLAEALLRIPDSETIDKLIRDKITQADWESHLGKSQSLFVNAATWALMLTGKVIEYGDAAHQSLGHALKRLANRSSGPLIRQSILQAMRIMGRQFVMGRTIQEALTRAKSNESKGYRYSYDMLGEGALTDADAVRYLESYQKAIAEIAKAAKGKGVVKGPGISVKLSALHPRYEVKKQERVFQELLPRLKTLCLQAKEANIGFTVDAEESWRLELSLELIEAIILDPQFAGWDGFGLAVQAYQKRAPYVIDWLAALCRKANRKIMVRLVKGAYWDTEIKGAQVEGLSEYPVYTRKVATDVSYLACVKKCFANQDVIYPQFATHNAYTLSAVIELAQGSTEYEFQCLHGMGDALYDSIVGFGADKYPCRIYAPVGSHEDLLAYLVRRLLENGANTSFVNRIVNEKLPIEELIENPVAQLQASEPKPHPKISLPPGLYQPNRANSMGVDLKNPAEYMPLLASIHQALEQLPEIKLPVDFVEKDKIPVISPHDNQHVVGYSAMLKVDALPQMLEIARQGFLTWHLTPVQQRAECLRKMAKLLEQHQAQVMALLMREAGKTIEDALSELREAVDFCHYYAHQAELNLQHPIQMPGPTGETNTLSYVGRGVFICISPWNFPLAIFLGQVVAALVAGNAVLAKPAEQTSLIASLAIDLLHKAGIPKEVVQLVMGKGSVVGAQLVNHPKIAGVIFTGSTDTAKRIQHGLADSNPTIVPFVAETGGMNTMIADSSALPEQVVKDVVISAFQSSGQRCSALRVLYLQEEVADKVLTMLTGAMKELEIGDPIEFTTDIGPVIDKKAQAELCKYIETASKKVKLLYQTPIPGHLSEGCFVSPTLLEIQSMSDVPGEVFGPILHVVRYKASQLNSVLDQINETGFGLTLGIHSRISETVQEIVDKTHVGNVYVNRNMIGAVVGVQPFGGEGLSGTGPKAGGPNYLLKLCTERTLTINTTAAGGNTNLMSLV